LTDAERKEHVRLNVVKANYGPSGNFLGGSKRCPVQGWQAIKLEPVLLLPKNQDGNLKDELNRQNHRLN
jgi:hypothetical protein